MNTSRRSCVRIEKNTGTRTGPSNAMGIAGGGALGNAVAACIVGGGAVGTAAALAAARTRSRVAPPRSATRICRRGPASRGHNSRGRVAAPRRIAAFGSRRRGRTSALRTLNL